MAMVVGKFLQAMRIAVMREPRRLPRLPGEFLRYFDFLRVYQKLSAWAGRKGQTELEPVLLQDVGNMPLDAHYVYQSGWAA